MVMTCMLVVVSDYLRYLKVRVLIPYHLTYALSSNAIDRLRLKAKTFELPSNANNYLTIRYNTLQKGTQSDYS